MHYTSIFYIVITIKMLHTYQRQLQISFQRDGYQKDYEPNGSKKNDVQA